MKNKIYPVRLSLFISPTDLLNFRKILRLNCDKRVINSPITKQFEYAAIFLVKII